MGGRERESARGRVRGAMCKREGGATRDEGKRARCFERWTPRQGGCGAPASGDEMKQRARMGFECYVVRSEQPCRGEKEGAHMRRVGLRAAVASGDTGVRGGV